MRRFIDLIGLTKKIVTIGSYSTLLTLYLACYLASHTVNAETELSKNSYITIGPKSIRPGGKYDFYVQSLIPNLGSFRAELILERIPLGISSGSNETILQRILAQAQANNIRGIKPYRISFNIPTDFPLSAREAVTFPSNNVVSLRIFVNNNTTISNSNDRSGTGPNSQGSTRSASSALIRRPGPIIRPTPINTRNQTQLMVNPKTRAILIQLDKGKYKPGDLVRFRIIVVNANLKPVSGNINIFITDPKDNRVKQWLDEKLIGGIVTADFRLVDRATLGFWTLSVLFSDKKIDVGDSVAVSIATATPDVSKSFEVAEFVLPTFDVTLPTQPWGVADIQKATNDGNSVQSIKVRVKGNFEPKFTFGGTVEGRAIITFKDNFGRFDAATQTFKTESVSKTILTSTSDVTGKYPFELVITYERPNLSTEELQNLLPSFTFGRGYEVSLEFQDAQTLKSITKSNFVPFYDYPLSLSITGPSFFKPGLPYSVQITVGQADGSPLPITNEFLSDISDRVMRAPFNPVRVQLKRTINYVEPIRLSPHILTNLLISNSKSVETQKRTPNDTFSNIVIGSAKGHMVQYSIPTLIKSENVSIGLTASNTKRESSPPPNSFIVKSQGFIDGITLQVSNIQYEAQIIGQSRTAFFGASRFEEPDNIFLELRDSRPSDQASTPLRLGKSHRITAVSTQPLAFLTVVFVSKGRVYAIKTYENKNGPRTKIDISFPVDAGLAPNFNVLAYSVAGPKKTVIADSLSFRVDQFSANFVNLTFSPGENVTPIIAPFEDGSNGTSILTLGPRERVVLNVLTAPNSRIGLLAVDKSVQLLSQGAGNDITRDAIESELNAFSASSSDSFGPFFFFGSFGNTLQIFERSNLLVLTDANIFTPPTFTTFPVFSELARPVAFTTAAPQRDGAAGSGGGSLNKEIVTRTDFPETWIWVDVNANNQGKASVNELTPDTITTWVASALSLDTKAGLGISSVPGELRVFQPFFVNLNLPFSVIRNERVRIQAIVFNFLGRNVKASVIISGPENLADPEFEILPPFSQTTIDLPDSSTKTVFFWIKPLKVGLSKIKVTARIINDSVPDGFPGDAIEKTLPIKAEGETQFFNKPLLITLNAVASGAEPSLEQTVDIDWNEENFIPGSNFLDICTIGDIMGPSLANIGNLIRLPYGCGEQNMVNFAPNLYIWAYLQARGLTTLAIRAKIVDFTEQGYQRQLTFQRFDGSFSAFGNNDPRGSIWLTALVVRSFALASTRGQGLGLIFVQDKIIRNALNFLLDNQVLQGRPAYLIGSFVEIGIVHNKALQGGSTKGSFALTCYVYISLRQLSDGYFNLQDANKDNLKAPEDAVLRNRLIRAILLSERFILNSLADISNSTEISNYDLAIGYYALTLAKQNPISQSSLDDIIAQWAAQNLPNTPSTPSPSGLLFGSNVNLFDPIIERIGVLPIPIPIPPFLPIPIGPLPNDNFTFNVRDEDIIALLRAINLPAQNAMIGDTQEVVWAILNQRKITVDQGLSIFWPAFPRSQRTNVFGPNGPITLQIPGNDFLSWDFETTAYVLLALAVQNRIDDGTGPLKWLVSRRNSLGGFASTQDTIIALDALANFAKLLPQPSQQLLHVFYTDVRNAPIHDIHLDSRNLLVLDCFSLGTKLEPEIRIRSVGVGTALVQVSWGYNIIKNTSLTPFVLEVRTRRTTTNTTLLVDICFSFNPSTPGSQSNMAILEVNSLSGYIVSRESSNELPSFGPPFQQAFEKQRDFSDGDTKVTFYFDSVGSARSCITTLRLVQLQLVEDVRPALVRISDYYQPGLKAIGFIEIPLA